MKFHGFLPATLRRTLATIAGIRQSIHWCSVCQADMAEPFCGQRNFVVSQLQPIQS